MELLFGPGEGIDPGEEVDGVLGAWGEGAPGLFDQFEEDRGNTDLLGKVGLGEAGDLADGMEWMDFGWDPSGSAGFVNLHLTKDTCIPYSVNQDDYAGEQQSEDQLRKYRLLPGSAVHDTGAGGRSVSDIDEDG